jgi:hypothetical protein
VALLVPAVPLSTPPGRRGTSPRSACSHPVTLLPTQIGDPSCNV